MPSDAGRPSRNLERLLSAPTAQKARELLDRSEGLEPEDRARFLVKAFASRHWDIRKAASEKLADLEDAIVLPMLQESLADQKAGDNVIFWTVQTLASRGGDASNLLLEFLPSCPAELRIFVIKSLGKSRVPQATEQLVEMLGSPDYATREEAAHVLAGNADESVASVRQLLNSGNPDQKFWAFKILAKVMGTKAVEPLTKILKNPAEEQQGAYALAALKEIRHPSIIPTLIGLLGHDSWYYRAEAAEMLQDLGAMAVPELKRILESDNPDIRFWGMKILREILGGEVVPILEKFITSDQKSTRYSAVLTVGGLRDAGAARMLIDCFDDEAWIIRKLASDHLIRMGDVALKFLLDNLSSDSEESIYWTLVTLGKMRDDAAEPFVARLLEHDSKNVRLHTVDCLAGIGSQPAAAALVGAFRNSIWTVRQRACEALGQLGEPALRSLLLHVEDPDGDVAYWTDRTLSAFLSPGLPRLLADLKRARPDERDAMMRHIRAVAPETLAELVRSSSANREALLRLPIPKQAAFADPVAEAPKPKGQSRILSLFETPGAGSYPMTMDEILLHAQKCGASDLHIKINCPPLLRIHGSLTQTNFPKITEEASRLLFSAILTDHQKHQLAENLQLDLSYEVTEGCRFRLNLYKQTRGLEAAARYIEPEIPNFRSLNLPDWVFQKISSFADGLVLVTGPTGSGKSTTMASIIGHINRNFSRHIITIEDPIEYVHENILSYISYREVGMDVRSFPLGLRGALREDPDVILIGELRDKDTIATALTLAGTGHLVLSTFHTSSASQTVEQIIDFFESDQQTHIRRQVAFILRSIVSQRLLPKTDGKGRVPALEILMSTHAVRNLIRDGNLQQLYSVMQAGAEDGMQTFDSSLMELVGSRQISYEDALPFVLDMANFKPSGHGGR